jgi:hypothetical protein
MKIQWEYDLVEKPFCEQLETMCWQCLERALPDWYQRKEALRTATGNFLSFSLARNL